MKIRLKIRKIWNHNKKVQNFSQNISWTISMNIYKFSELMSSPHKFPFNLFTEMTQISHFSYERVKLGLKVISTLNKCKILFNTPIYFDMGTCFWMFEQKKKISSKYLIQNMEICEVMTSSTHSFAYSFRLFKKCLMKHCDTLQFHIFLYFIFNPFFITFSLFYLIFFL